MQRKVGLDFARIMAMLGIITLHILGNGGVLNNLQAQEVNYWIFWAIEILAYCSVDVFAMLSGYLSIEKSKFSMYRLLELILSLMFYTISITAFFFLFYKEKIWSLKTIIKSLFPMLAGRYWYIMCFIIVYFAMPILNLLLRRLTYKECKKIGITMFVLISVIPSFAYIDFFAIKSGYSAMWLIICYFWGGMIKKRENEKNEIMSSRCLIICCVCLLIVFLARVMLYFVTGRGIDYLCSYISPFIVIASVMLLMMAKKCFLECSIKLKKLLLLLSKYAFDVYLLHCHILIYDIILKDNFLYLCDIKSYLIPLLLGLIILSVYCLGVVTGIIRNVIFKLLKIDVVLKNICKSIDKYLFMDIQNHW